MKITDSSVSKQMLGILMAKRAEAWSAIRGANSSVSFKRSWQMARLNGQYSFCKDESQEGTKPGPRWHVRNANRLAGIRINKHEAGRQRRASKVGGAA
jgi:hypothetical protein